MGSGLLDADELKSHIFFSDLDFNKYLYKKFTPPDLNNYYGINSNKEKPFHNSFKKRDININLKCIFRPLPIGNEMFLTSFLAASKEIKNEFLKNIESLPEEEQNIGKAMLTKKVRKK